MRKRKKLIKKQIYYPPEKLTYNPHAFLLLVGLGINFSGKLNGESIIDVLDLCQVKKSGKKSLGHILELHPHAISQAPALFSQGSSYQDLFLKTIIQGSCSWVRYSHINEIFCSLTKLSFNAIQASFGNLAKYLFYGREFKDYYKNLSSMINEKIQRYGYDDPELFYQVLAITSTRTHVASNFKLACRAYTILKNGKEITGFLGTVKAGLQTLQRTGEISSRKLADFYFALKGKENCAVIDTWILRAFCLDRPYDFKGVRYSTMPSKKIYDFIQSYIQIVAQGIGWTPIEVGAALWSGIRIAERGSKIHYY